MLYEFAILPDVFSKDVVEEDKANYIIIKEILKGIVENGMLANLQNSKLINYIMNDKLQYLSPSTRNDLIILMNTLKSKKRIVPYTEEREPEPSKDTDWIDLALDINQNDPFHGIVFGQKHYEFKTAEHNNMLKLDDVLDSGCWLGRKRTKDILQGESDFRNCLAPILKHARSVSIIDPYLSIEQRFFDTVVLCLDLIKKSNVRVHIHCRLKKDEYINDVLSNWETEIKSLHILEKNHRIKIFIWKDRRGGQKFHDRSIITDQCGVSIEGGLDCYDGIRSTKTTIALLDDDVSLRRLTDVNPASRVYDLLKQREITL